MKILKNCVIILSISFLCSCASSTQGKNQKITINSLPINATAITSHGYGCDATPCSFNVPRNKSFSLKVTKSGFTTKKINIKSTLSGIGAAKGLGSIVLGGVIAGGYDIYNGAILELVPNSVNVKLENMSTLLHEEVRLVSNMNLFGENP
jgi:hypothetical protein